MRRWISILGAVAALLLAPSSHADGVRRHQVSAGQTLGKIAKRYQVTVPALCTANGIRRKDPLKLGQSLVIPEADDADGSRAAEEREREDAAPAGAPSGSAPALTGMQTLVVPGAPPAYYYEPIGPGRLGLRPVVMYLHGRGGQPASDCQRWASVARRFGWLVCPSGPEDRGGGARGWDNAWPVADHVVKAALTALREKYGKRVQLSGNTLIGFSEGAYVAMNVAVRDARTWNRWLILAADSDYWGGPGIEALRGNRTAIKRVYLITGRQDGVYDSTQQVQTWLKREGVATRVSLPEDMGHEVPLVEKAAMYRAALAWLDRGTGEPSRGRAGTKTASRH